MRNGMRKKKNSKFFSVVRFRHQLVNKKRLNLLHSRCVAKCTPCVLQACAEACVCNQTPLSDKPGQYTNPVLLGNSPQF